MKNIARLLTAAAFVVTLGAVPSFAQTATVLKADVPFSFAVRGKAMPAGEYTITENSGSALLVVRNTETEQSVSVMAGWTAKHDGAAESRLVFRVAGNQHHLATVETTGQDSARVIQRTAAEREAESAGTRQIVAFVKAVRQQ